MPAASIINTFAESTLVPSLIKLWLTGCLVGCCTKDFCTGGRLTFIIFRSLYLTLILLLMSSTTLDRIQDLLRPQFLLLWGLLSSQGDMITVNPIKSHVSVEALNLRVRMKNSFCKVEGCGWLRGTDFLWGFALSLLHWLWCRALDLRTPPSLHAFNGPQCSLKQNAQKLPVSAW